MQNLDLAIVPVGSVSWEQKLHLLESESNPGGETRFDKLELLTAEAFKVSQIIEAERC
ncbi:MAG: hypothetical protein ACRC62_05190 [Microcoleus sp.]